MKHALTPGEGAKPAFGIIGTAVIPSGDDAGSQIDGSIGALWSNSLGKGFGLFGTATFGTTSFGEDRRNQFSNAVGLSYSPGGAHGFFIEHFVQATEGIDADVGYIDGGYTYLLRQNVQLDLNGGISVGDADAGSFIGGGLAIRY
ncbi:transporter [Parvularcula lutaonensis]|uniref:Transporter n=1 Tax=Parvularcula lutaonensis TaxID=491923 RepID=A0ABV7MAL6_9PROT|nr:transporter [Parvularcula lutaonensis]